MFEVWDFDVQSMGHISTKYHHGKKYYQNDNLIFWDIRDKLSSIQDDNIELRNSKFH